MKTVVFSHAIHEASMEKIGAKAKLIIAGNADTASYIDDIRQAEALVVRIGKVGRDIIESCPKLAVIAYMGVGVDTIDTGAAAEHGIPVTITPGANSRSAAEHTMALLYATAKNLVESHIETRKGNYAIRNKGATMELRGRRAAVVGFGAIGRQVARLMRNNDLEVSVYDPLVKRETVEQLGYVYESDLHGMLNVVDIVSLHVPALPETRGLFDEAAFNAMRRGSILINCARGDVVVEKALYNAMTDGTVGAAGVDVMYDEPMDPSSPLFTLPNFVATPHMAALTREAYKAMSDMVAGGVLATLDGQKWPHVYNPKAYEHSRWANR